MIYTCTDCGFVFARISKVTQCPSCEKSHLREATEQEKNTLQLYLKNQENMEREGKRFK